MRPIEVLLGLLSERNGEIPTRELYELMESGGCFFGKNRPDTAFRLSIDTNVRLGKIVQSDAAGNVIEKMNKKAPIAGTTRLKK